MRVPTLVIWAEEDLALPPPFLDRMEAFVPEVHLARLTGATHWAVPDQPVRIAAEIERELAS